MLSHTAYSSAVRRGSVAIRQRATIAPSLISAKTTLVLPASTASSMDDPSDQEHIACVNDTHRHRRQAQHERTVGVEPFEQALDRPAVGQTRRQRGAAGARAGDRQSVVWGKGGS